jgi:endonuclease/exonuclease/phosphatase family metal-dependent hydrolase
MKHNNNYGKKILRVGTMNVHGFHNNTKEIELKMLMNQMNIEVCAVQETFLLQGEERKKEREWSETNRKERAFKTFWKMRENSRQRRGGVGLIFDERMSVEIEKEGAGELIWTKLLINGMLLFVATLYLVPSSSPKHIRRNNETVLDELEKDIVKYQKMGAVIVLGDMNARVKNKKQIMYNIDEQLENEEQCKEVIFERCNEDDEENQNGKLILEMCNATHMILGNGIQHHNKSKTAQYTTKYNTVLDFIMYDVRFIEAMSEVHVYKTDIESDHFLVYMDVNLSSLSHLMLHHQMCLPSNLQLTQRVEDQQYVLRLPNPSSTAPVTRTKHRLETDEVRAEWFYTCNVVCENWINENNHLVDVNRMWASFYQSLKHSANTSRPTIKHKSRSYKTHLKHPSEHLRRMIEMRNAAEDEEVRKRWSRKIKILVRREKQQELKNTLREISESAKIRGSEHWKILKTAINWKTRNEDTHLIKSLKKDDGTSTQILDEMTEICAMTFEKLGNDEGDCRLFDEGKIQSINQTMNEIIQKEKERKQLGNVVEEKLSEMENNSTLNKEIELDEVVSVIRNLRNGKAAGMDGITSEVLKYGGPVLWKCVWFLCRACFRSERIPKDWCDGLICMLYKDGDKENPLNYRGITLLSVMYKVYASILNIRLMKWSEEQSKLADEQNGFRPHRSCTDHLFALSEMIRIRKSRGESTYCAFIDLKKAYDRVFRNGLWVQLWNIGVKGKMWRVLTQIYKRVRSSVLVNGVQSRWFDLSIGLRQGCVLSPFLFDVFINPLVEKVKAVHGGITFKGSEMCVLMFADDIVLVSHSAVKLQQMLKAVESFCGQMKCEVNVKKTEVVIYGSYHKKDKVIFSLNNAELNVVKSYKYLGLILCASGRWKETRDRLKAKARSALSYALSMANTAEILSVESGSEVWMTLIRPILEYGAEVWSDTKWEEGERLQKLAAKRILRCSMNTTDEAVLGDLGWWRLKTRRDYLRLCYWAKLVNMDLSRITKRVYNYSKHIFNTQYKALLDESAALQSNVSAEVIRAHERQVRLVKTKNWCAATYELLLYYGLERYWSEPYLDANWTSMVEKVIHEKEEESWKHGVVMEHGQKKLRTYMLLKNKLKMEEYLVNSNSHDGAYAMFKLRSGTNTLRVETGRYEHGKGVERGQRICQMCTSGDVETEQHFLLHCNMFAVERLECYEKLARMDINMNELDDERKLHMLLGNIQRFEIIKNIVLSFIRKIYRKRERLQRFFT